MSLKIEHKTTSALGQIESNVNFVLLFLINIIWHRLEVFSTFIFSETLDFSLDKGHLLF